MVLAKFSSNAPLSAHASHRTQDIPGDMMTSVNDNSTNEQCERHKKWGDMPPPGS